MPGSVASVGVTVGSRVNAGDLLLTIEAMKMETGLHADRAATVKAVHVVPGAQIDAKDLLIELSEGSARFAVSRAGWPGYWPLPHIPWTS